jgi:uncharacterized SAM-binding protein YcdF (DUF218 family)
MSTGHTAGPEYPSEASAMLQAMRQRFDESRIPTSAILMEEESDDTLSNLQEVKKLCAEHDIESIVLLTIGYHLPRVRRLADVVDLSVSGSYASDHVVGRDRGDPDHYYAHRVLAAARERRSMKPLLRTGLSYALEAGGLVVARIDPQGDRLGNRITGKLRHRD